MKETRRGRRMPKRPWILCRPNESLPDDFEGSPNQARQWPERMRRLTFAGTSPSRGTSCRRPGHLWFPRRSRSRRRADRRSDLEIKQPAVVNVRKATRLPASSRRPHRRHPPDRGAHHVAHQARQVHEQREVLKLGLFRSDLRGRQLTPAQRRVRRRKSRLCLISPGKTSLSLRTPFVGAKIFSSSFSKGRKRRRPFHHGPPR
jgi:hypothetical protein